jgi:transposase
LLAYFDEPTTNDYAGGAINKLKVITRRAHGLPRFDGFRDQVLFAWIHRTCLPGPSCAGTKMTS